MNETPAFVLEGVGKRYPGPDRGSELWALRGLDLTLGPGEVLGLLGPNRAGKTTVAKLLTSLCRPTEGRLFRFGRPGSDRSTLACVGFVPGAPAFPPDMTAAGVLAYLGALALRHPEALRQRIPAVLERVGLADRAGEPLGRFSKGMLQRLGLAQAVLTEPALLVLDEPAEGLDLDGRRLLRGVVGEWREAGRSVLLISHAAGEVARLCDRAAVLVAGRKVFDGPVGALAGGPTVAEDTIESSLDRLFRSPAA